MTKIDMNDTKPEAVRAIVDTWAANATQSPSWDDAVECGCEAEWLDMYQAQNDG